MISRILNTPNFSEQSVKCHTLFLPKFHLVFLAKELDSHADAVRSGQSREEHTIQEKEKRTWYYFNAKDNKKCICIAHDVSLHIDSSDLKSKRPYKNSFKDFVYI